MLFNPNINVWLYSKQTDMRKSINGLSIIVAGDMNKNPTSGEIFLFFNKANDKIKILYWDKIGFCLWYKRLEKGWLRIPRDKAHISYEQLRWLLDGLDINQLHGHNRISYKKFF